MPESTAEKSVTIAAAFRKREDAYRAVIELREVEFPANAIGAAFREGPSAPSQATAMLSSEEAPGSLAPATTPEENKDPLLPPETPMTTLTGGSPFGEASTYKPPPAATEDWWEGMRVALPHANFKATSGAAKSQANAAREIAEPTDTNFEPADRPAPAYDSDYQTGDYGFEIHTFDSTSLAATLTAAGLDPSHASAIAQNIKRGESIVTITTTGRADEARSIFTRNNGVLSASIGSRSADMPGINSDERTDLRLYGEILRCHKSTS